MKHLLIPAVVLLLAGCSLFRGGNDEPMEDGERLVIPPDLSDERLGQVPDLPGRQSATLSQLGGGGGGASGLLPEPPGMRMQRQGAERWLEIDASPGEVWNWLNDYLEESGVSIVRRSEVLGVVETDWLPRPLGLSGGIFMPVPVDVEAPVLEQYVFRLEPMTGDQATELYVAHRRAMQVAGDNGGRWEPRDSDRGREAEALRGFMVHLGMREADAARTTAAADTRPTLAQLETRNGLPRLVINEAYLQGWRRTGLALDRAGFTVEDRDRSSGRYVVRYDPAAESDRSGRGFFSRLAFWRDYEPDLEPGNYVIQVSSDAGRTVLTVEGEEEEDEVPSGLAERLLVLIEEQLR